MLKAKAPASPEVDAASATMGPPSERTSIAALEADAKKSGGTAAAEWAGR